MSIFIKLYANINYTTAALLFLIGLYVVVSKSNLVKKLMGLNIMETSVFLLYISVGAVKGGKAPIVEEAASNSLFVNPIPQALILTGIVVAVSTTALALSLIIKIYEHCGTIEAEKLKEMEEV